MADDTMVQALRTTSLRLTELEAQIERLTTQADALRRIKSGIEDYLGLEADPAQRDAAEPDGGAADTRPPMGIAGPRGKEAVRAVLAERPGFPMTVAEIADQLVIRGWLDSPSRAMDATRTNIGRAVASYPEVRRLRPGVFVYENSDGPAETGPSDDTTTAPAVTAAGPDRGEVTGSDGDPRAPDHHPAPLTGAN